MKNESKSSEMIEIMQTLQERYVPTEETSKGKNVILPLFFGGDQLTEERARNLQGAMATRYMYQVNKILSHSWNKAFGQIKNQNIGLTSGAVACICKPDVCFGARDSERRGFASTDQLKIGGCLVGSRFQNYELLLYKWKH